MDNGGSEMKHNGLRKRLDVLGFTQPLPLGAVPLVGAILEDLIRTTESLRAHKDQVHNLLQEKKAWDLGVEAYKCDNSKLLAQASQLNKELIRQKDQYEAKKCEFSRRIRNLEMDKKYLEDHLQQMGERFEELEGKYQDALDPKRKSSRKPFVSTVKSGCLIPPHPQQHHQQWSGGIVAVCPSRCPASARRKDLDMERDRLQQDNVTLQESIDMQTKQIEVRDREIDRLSVLLSTEGRSVKALAEDCCYRNVKQLHEDIDHLQRENTRLKSQLACCTKTTVLSKGFCGEKMGKGCGCGQERAMNPSETQMKACQLAAKSCVGVQQQIEELDAIIKDLYKQISLCNGEDERVSLMDKLNDKLADRVKLQDSYVEKLSEHQKVIKRSTSLNRKGQENSENDPLRQCKNAGMNVETLKLQNEIACMRRELDQMSIFNQRQECVQDLRKQLTVKECEINTLRNRSCLTASSMMNANKTSESDRSWMGGIDSCRGSSVDRVCMDREHCLMAEKLQRLSTERDHLQYMLDNEISKFCVEREAFDNTLEKMKCRLEMVERDNRELLTKQEPKNAAITCMQSDVRSLRCQIEVLRTNNENLQCQVDQLKNEIRQKEQILAEAKHEKLQMDQKLKHSTRKCEERGNEEQKFLEEINKVNGELRKCRENYSSLESENSRILAALHTKMEDAQKFQSAVDGLKEGHSDLLRNYETMKKCYNEQLQKICSLQHQQREMQVEIDTYKCKIESLRKALDCSKADNTNLAEKLSLTECEYSNTKRQLMESQMRNDELQSKMKEYMLEVTRVGKLLEEKDKERDEWVENLKKMSEGSSRLRGENISLNADLCESKQKYEEANSQIRELQKERDRMEKEILNFKENTNKSIDDVCLMKAELDKCYETHKKLHSDSVELRNARQEMILSIEKLKNELETWKTLHDVKRDQNEKLKRELKALQCEDYPNNVKKMQQLLAEARENMDAQMHNTACLSSELATVKEQMNKYKQALETEKCKSDDPLKRYVEKASELEKLTRNDDDTKIKNVRIISSDCCSGLVRKTSDQCANMTVTKPKGDCGCDRLKMNCVKSMIVTAPDQVPLISDGKLTIKKQCATHSDTPRETVPIPRSKSLHGSKIANPCAMPTHRHQSCSPPRPQYNQNSSKFPFKQTRCDSNVPLKKMCAEVNLSGMVNVPPMQAFEVSANAGTDTSVTRLLDDVRTHGQAKKQWSSCDEIEEKIKSQKRGSLANVDKFGTSQQERKNIAQDKPCELSEPLKATEVTSAAPQKPPMPMHQPTPPRRLDIPRRTLVDSFIATEKLQEKGSDDLKKREEVSLKPPANALEKGFNHVMTEIKSFTHQILGKPDDESISTKKPEEDQPIQSPVFTDSVKQRIQRFQEIVNDSSRSGSRPAIQIRGGSQVPDQKDKKTLEKPQQPSIIKRVIDSISQGGIQGLSMLHKEDDEASNNTTELNRESMEHEKSELLNHSSPPNKSPTPPAIESTPAHRGHLTTPRNSRTIPSAALSKPATAAPIQSAPSLPKSSTPANLEVAEENAIPTPIIPTIELSPTESVNEDPVYDLTESLLGGQSTSTKDTDTPSTTTDSELEYIPNELTYIHTVSSATRQASQRSTAANVAKERDTDDRFHRMIHTEPSLMKQEEYNKFVKKSMANGNVMSSSDVTSHRVRAAAVPRNQLNNSSNPSQRRSTIPFQTCQYGRNNHNIVGEKEKLRGRVSADQVVQQDDGCVATSTASDSSEISMTHGHFMAASSSKKAPLQRAGKSALDTVRTNPPAYRKRFVEHRRGHDIRASVPHSTLLSHDDNFGGDISSSTAESSSDAFNHLDSFKSASGDTPLPGYSTCHGLKGGNNYLEDDEEQGDGDEEEEPLGMWSFEDNESLDNVGYQPFDSQSCTPQSFQGPYENQFNAEDSLRNLNVHMSHKLERQSFHNGPEASYQSQKNGKDIKLVNATDQHLQRNYLDGLQSSREASSNDEMSVTGSNTGSDSQSMLFYCSISKSMDQNKPELNVNLMLLGDDGEAVVEDERSDSQSCMSECTQLTHNTKISVEDVYLTYSSSQLSESMLRSLMHDRMGGGEDSNTATEKGNEAGFNDESIWNILDDIYRRNGLLSTSDELSLASASVPALHSQSSGEE